MTVSRLIEDACASGAIPGASAVIIDRHGTRYQAAAGVRDTSTSAPMTLDTVFWIASMTKPLTSITALQLVDEGLLSLDAPIEEVLPQLAHRQVLDGFDTDGAPRLHPATQPMTLRRLLNHTSGYGYPRWDDGLQRAMASLGLRGMIRDWDELAQVPLVFEPGARWMYGIGIDIAGKMIEAVTGLPLDAAIDARVCAPLGMTDTSFVLNDDQRNRAAPVHVRDAGRWVPSGPVGGRSLGFLSGGGGMYGTAPDYAKLMAELLAGAPNLLARESWAELTRNQIGDLRVQVLRNAGPEGAVETDMSGGQPAVWGLGFMINTAPLPGRRGAGSLFWAGLANTYFWVDPAAGIAGTLMMPLLPFGHPAALALFEAFEEAAYAA